MFIFRTFAILALLFSLCGTGLVAHAQAGDTVDPVQDAGSDTVDPTQDSGSDEVDPIQDSGRKSTTITNPIKAESITEFFLDIIRVVLVLATPLIVFFIILAGFKFVMAQGKPEKLTEAKRALLFAIIGGLLILGAFVILEVIQGTIDAFTL